jgi:Na+/melibiose symporter-like transporter
MVAVTYSVVPASFKFVTMLLFWNYPLTEKIVAERQSELAEMTATDK